jgi:hypothetical protein
MDKELSKIMRRSAYGILRIDILWFYRDLRYRGGSPVSQDVGSSD